MASPLYKMPNPLLYRFTLEPEVLKEVEEYRKLEISRNNELERKYQQFLEEKIQRQKVAARKIAPGFLDTDTKILTPKPLNATTNGQSVESDVANNLPNSINLSRHSRSMSDEVSMSRLVLPEQGVKPSTSVSSGLASKKQNNLNYLEFEQGLAPLDPWDTPENDIDALQEIWEGRSNVKTDPRRRTLNQVSAGNQAPYQPSPGHPPQRNYQQQQLQNSMPLPPKQLPYPPTQHYTMPHPASGTSSPIQHTYPPMRSPSPVPPARPPKAFDAPTPPPLPAPVPVTQENDATSGLIQELTDMGFSREQAQNALEKNGNDISKATNFLLDFNE
ncbi:hypothetical protein Unana1_05020 [Umbelopsis nana]